MERFEISNRAWGDGSYRVERRLTAKERAAKRQKKSLDLLPNDREPKFPSASSSDLRVPMSNSPMAPREPDVSGFNTALTSILPLLSASTAAPATASKAEAAAIRVCGFAALCFYGPSSIVPRALGDTVGVRPIFPYVSKSWNDTLSSQMDRDAPIFWQGLLFRVWLRSKLDAKRLDAELPGLLSTKGPAQRGRWFDIGATDVRVLQSDVIALANRHELQTFTDLDVLQFARAQVSTAKPN